MGPILPMQVEPDADGRFTYPDGSEIWPSPTDPGWLASWPKGIRLCDRDYTGPALFDTPKEAQAALIQGNAGPRTEAVSKSGWWRQFGPEGSRRDADGRMRPTQRDDCDQLSCSDCRGVGSRAAGPSSGLSAARPRRSPRPTQRRCRRWPRPPSARRHREPGQSRA